MARKNGSETTVNVNKKAPISLIDHFNKRGINSLKQVSMLREALDTCKNFGGLWEAYLRGSLARGNADKLSDVDLFVVVDPATLPEFSEAFDKYIRENYKPMIPRCYDRHVADYGGLGFMYLLEGDDGEVYQFDIYYAMKGRVTDNRLQDFVEKIYSKDPNYCWHSSTFSQRGSGNGFKVPIRTAKYISEFHDLRKCEENIPKIVKQLFVEMCVHAHLMKKHTSRGDLFRASADRYYIEQTFIALLRQKYDPYYADTGHQGVPAFQHELMKMGEIEHELSSQIDYVISMKLEKESAKKIMEFCSDFVKREFPDIYKELQPELGCYMEKEFDNSAYIVEANDNREGIAKEDGEKPSGRKKQAQDNNKGPS